MIKHLRFLLLALLLLTGSNLASAQTFTDETRAQAWYDFMTALLDRPNPVYYVTDEIKDNTRPTSAAVNYNFVPMSKFILGNTFTTTSPSSDRTRFIRIDESARDLFATEAAGKISPTEIAQVTMVFDGFIGTAGLGFTDRDIETRLANAETAGAVDPAVTARAQAWYDFMTAAMTDTNVSVTYFQPGMVTALDPPATGARAFPFAPTVFQFDFAYPRRGNPGVAGFTFPALLADEAMRTLFTTHATGKIAPAEITSLVAEFVDFHDRSRGFSLTDFETRIASALTAGAVAPTPTDPSAFTNASRAQAWYDFIVAVFAADAASTEAKTYHSSLGEYFPTPSALPSVLRYDFAMKPKVLVFGSTTSATPQSGFTLLIPVSDSLLELFRTTASGKIAESEIDDIITMGIGVRDSNFGGLDFNGFSATELVANANAAVAAGAMGGVLGNDGVPISAAAARAQVWYDFLVALVADSTETPAYRENFIDYYEFRPKPSVLEYDFVPMASNVGGGSSDSPQAGYDRLIPFTDRTIGLFATNARGKISDSEIEDVTMALGVRNALRNSLEINGFALADVVASANAAVAAGAMGGRLGDDGVPIAAAIVARAQGFTDLYAEILATKPETWYVPNQVTPLERSTLEFFAVDTFPTPQEVTAGSVSSPMGGAGRVRVIHGTMLDFPDLVARHLDGNIPDVELPGHTAIFNGLFGDDTNFPLRGFLASDLQDRIDETVEDGAVRPPEPMNVTTAASEGRIQSVHRITVSIPSSSGLPRGERTTLANEAEITYTPTDVSLTFTKEPGAASFTVPALATDTDITITFTTAEASNDRIYAGTLEFKLLANPLMVSREGAKDATAGQSRIVRLNIDAAKAGLNIVQALAVLNGDLELDISPTGEPWDSLTFENDPEDDSHGVRTFFVPSIQNTVDITIAFTTVADANGVVYPGVVEYTVLADPNYSDPAARAQAYYDFYEEVLADDTLPVTYYLPSEFESQERDSNAVYLNEEFPTFSIVSLASTASTDTAAGGRTRIYEMTEALQATLTSHLTGEISSGELTAVNSFIDSAQSGFTGRSPGFTAPEIDTRVSLLIAAGVNTPPRFTNLNTLFTVSTGEVLTLSQPFVVTDSNTGADGEVTYAWSIVGDGVGSLANVNQLVGVEYTAPEVPLDVTVALRLTATDGSTPPKSAFRDVTIEVTGDQRAYAQGWRDFYLSVLTDPSLPFRYSTTGNMQLQTRAETGQPEDFAYYPNFFNAVNANAIFTTDESHLIRVFPVNAALYAHYERRLRDVLLTDDFQSLADLMALGGYLTFPDMEARIDDADSNGARRPTTSNTTRAQGWYDFMAAVLAHLEATPSDGTAYPDGVVDLVARENTTGFAANQYDYLPNFYTVSDDSLPRGINPPPAGFTAVTPVRRAALYELYAVHLRGKVPNIEFFSQQEYFDLVDSFVVFFSVPDLEARLALAITDGALSPALVNQRRAQGWYDFMAAVLTDNSLPKTYYPDATTTSGPNLLRPEQRLDDFNFIPRPFFTRDTPFAEAIAVDIPTAGHTRIFERSPALYALYTTHVAPNVPSIEVTSETDFNNTRRGDFSEADMRTRAANAVTASAVPPANRTPVITIPSPDGGFRVLEGEMLTIDGVTITDPDIGTLSYAWTVTGAAPDGFTTAGLINADTPRVSFTAPMVTENVTVTLLFVVDDGAAAGGTDAERVTLQILNITEQRIYAQGWHDFYYAVLSDVNLPRTFVPSALTPEARATTGQANTYNFYPNFFNTTATPVNHLQDNTVRIYAIDDQLYAHYVTHLKDALSTSDFQTLAQLQANGAYLSEADINTRISNALTAGSFPLVVTEATRAQGMYNFMSELVEITSDRGNPNPLVTSTPYATQSIQMVDRSTLGQLAQYNFVPNLFTLPAAHQPGNRVHLMISVDQTALYGLYTIHLRGKFLDSEILSQTELAALGGGGAHFSTIDFAARRMDALGRGAAVPVPPRSLAERRAQAWYDFMAALLVDTTVQQRYLETSRYTLSPRPDTGPLSYDFVPTGTTPVGVSSPTPQPDYSRFIANGTYVVNLFATQAAGTLPASEIEDITMALGARRSLSFVIEGFNVPDLIARANMALDAGAMGPMITDLGVPAGDLSRAQAWYNFMQAVMNHETIPPLYYPDDAFTASSRTGAPYAADFVPSVFEIAPVASSTTPLPGHTRHFEFSSIVQALYKEHIEGNVPSGELFSSVSISGFGTDGDGYSLTDLQTRGNAAVAAGAVPVGNRVAVITDPGNEVFAPEGRFYTIETVSVVDPDFGPNGMLTYSWTVAGTPPDEFTNGNLINADTLNMSFVAPQATRDFQMHFELTVTDGGTPPLMVTSGNVTVTVENADINDTSRAQGWHDFMVAMLADSNLPQTYFLNNTSFATSERSVDSANFGKRADDFDFIPTTFTLDTEEPTIVDTPTLGYSRYFAINSAMYELYETYVVPNVPSTEQTPESSVRLFVTSQNYLSEADLQMRIQTALAVSGVMAYNIPPNIIVSDTTREVLEEEMFTLSGVTATDHNLGVNGDLTYQWSVATGGTTTGLPDISLTGADTLSMSFTAPTVRDDATVVFTLRVTDGGTPPLPSQVDVTVAITNAPVSIDTRAQAWYNFMVALLTSEDLSQQHYFPVTLMSSERTGQSNIYNFIPTQYSVPVSDTFFTEYEPGSERLIITNTADVSADFAMLAETILGSGLTAAEVTEWTTTFTAQKNQATTRLFGMTVSDIQSRMLNARNRGAVVDDALNTPPFVNVVAETREVRNGQSYVMGGVTVRDIDGGANSSLTYAWTIQSGGGGLFNESALVPEYTSPTEIDGNVTAVLRLTVTDGGTPALTDVVDVRVIVLDSTPPPVVLPPTPDTWQVAPIGEWPTELHTGVRGTFAIAFDRVRQGVTAEDEVTLVNEDVSFTFSESGEPWDSLEVYELFYSNLDEELRLEDSDDGSYYFTAPSIPADVTVTLTATSALHGATQCVSATQAEVDASCLSGGTRFVGRLEYIIFGDPRHADNLPDAPGADETVTFSLFGGANGDDTVESEGGVPLIFGWLPFVSADFVLPNSLLSTRLAPDEDPNETIARAAVIRFTGPDTAPWNIAQGAAGAVNITKTIVPITRSDGSRGTRVSNQFSFTPPRVTTDTNITLQVQVGNRLDGIYRATREYKILATDVTANGPVILFDENGAVTNVPINRTWQMRVTEGNDDARLPTTTIPMGTSFFVELEAPVGYTGDDDDLMAALMASTGGFTMGRVLLGRPRPRITENEMPLPASGLILDSDLAGTITNMRLTFSSNAVNQKSINFTAGSLAAEQLVTFEVTPNANSGLYGVVQFTLGADENHDDFTPVAIELADSRREVSTFENLVHRVRGFNIVEAESAGSVTYEWTVTDDGDTGLTTEMLMDADTPSLRFTAPEVLADATIVLSLLATKVHSTPARAGTATESVTVTIQNGEPPSSSSTYALPIDPLSGVPVDYTWRVVAKYTRANKDAEPQLVTTTQPTPTNWIFNVSPVRPRGRDLTSAEIIRARRYSTATVSPLNLTSDINTRNGNVFNIDNRGIFVFKASSVPTERDVTIVIDTAAEFTPPGEPAWRGVYVLRIAADPASTDTRDPDDPVAGFDADHIYQITVVNAAGEVIPDGDLIPPNTDVTLRVRAPDGVDDASDAARDALKAAFGRALDSSLLDCCTSGGGSPGSFVGHYLSNSLGWFGLSLKSTPIEQTVRFVVETAAADTPDGAGIWRGFVDLKIAANPNHDGGLIIRGHDRPLTAVEKRDYQVESLSVVVPDEYTVENGVRTLARGAMTYAWTVMDDGDTGLVTEMPTGNNPPPFVLLMGADTLTPSFTAPDVTTDTAVVLRLTMATTFADNSEPSVSEDITITIKNVDATEGVLTLMSPSALAVTDSTLSFTAAFPSGVSLTAAEQSRLLAGAQFEYSPAGILSNEVEVVYFGGVPSIVRNGVFVLIDGATGEVSYGVTVPSLPNNAEVTVTVTTPVVNDRSFSGTAIVRFAADPAHLHYVTPPREVELVVLGEPRVPAGSGQIITLALPVEHGGLSNREQFDVLSRAQASIASLGLGLYDFDFNLRSYTVPSLLEDTDVTINVLVPAGDDGVVYSGSLEVTFVADPRHPEATPLPDAIDPDNVERLAVAFSASSEAEMMDDMGNVIITECDAYPHPTSCVASEATVTLTFSLPADSSLNNLQFTTLMSGNDIEFDITQPSGAPAPWDAVTFTQNPSNLLQFTAVMPQVTMRDVLVGVLVRSTAPVNGKYIASDIEFVVTQAPDEAPVITDMVTTGRSVASGDEYSLTGITVTDAESSILTYAWRVHTNPFLDFDADDLTGANTLSPRFTAPSLLEEFTREGPNQNTPLVSSTSLRFVLTVTDANGAAVAMPVRVTLRTFNEAPMITLAEQSFMLTERDALTLSGVTVTDDGTDTNNFIDYEWTVVAGGGTLADADTLTPTYTAPSVTEDSNATLRLTATDRAALPLSTTENVTIQISDLNTVPVISVVEEERLVGEGETYTLSGVSVVDSDSGAKASLTYLWALVGGGGTLAAINGLAPEYTAPLAANIGATEDAGAVLRLTVTDGGTPPLTATVDVVVSAANAAPRINDTMADAPARTLEEDLASTETFRIQGIDVTDVNSGVNGQLTYAWEIVSGGGMLLDRTNGLDPRFTPPQVIAESKVVLRFMATDGGTPPLSAMLDVTLTVTNVVQPNNPPVLAVTSANRTVIEGQTYMMSGVSVDDADAGANGDITYTWTILGSDGMSLSFAEGGSLSFAGDNGETLSQLTPRYTAPFVDVLTTVTLRLVVADSGTLPPGVTDEANRPTDTRDIPVTITDVNTAPEIIDDVITRTIAESMVLTLSGITVMDANAGANGMVTYEWTVVSGGGSVANMSELVGEYSAPLVTVDTNATLMLTATDGGMPSLNDSVLVTVTVTNTIAPPPPNTTPVINVAAPTAPNDSDRPVEEGRTRTLSGITATDADTGSNGALVYAWTVVSGGGELASADTLSPRYTAPQVELESNATLRLTVTDGGTPPMVVTADVTLKITDRNTAPVITVEIDETQVRTVAENMEYVLSGISVADSDMAANGVVNYAWTVVFGGGTFADANSLTPTYTAPEVGADRTVMLRLTATDTGSPPRRDTANVAVLVTNVLPLVNTAPEITVEVDEDEPRVVGEGLRHSVIDVSVEDAHGTVSYSWALVGTGGSLANIETLSPIYTAPQVDVETIATLRLTATDIEGLADTADVFVTIENTNSAPMISGHEAIHIVDEGEDFTLSGISVFDAQAEVLIYTWTIVDANRTALVNNSLMARNTLTPSLTVPTVLSSRDVVLGFAAQDPGGLTDVVHVTLRITKAAGSSMVTHTVIIPEVTRSIAANLADTIGGRVNALRVGGAFGYAQIAGHDTVAGFLAARGNTRDAKSLLNNTKFNLPFTGGSSVDGMGKMALWGGLDYRSVNGDTDGIEWKGTLTGMKLGIDGVLPNNKIVGVAISNTTGSLEYGDRDAPYDVSLMGMHPYIGWKQGARDWWATAGISSGEVELEDGGITEDLSMQNLALGASGWRASLFGGSAVMGGEFTHSSSEVGGAEVSGTRVRASADFSRTSGSTSHGATAAMRGDFGDGDTGYGAEVGYGVNHRPSQRTTLSANIRTLLFHTAGFGELTLQANLRRRSGADGQGVSLTLSPTYRGTATDFESGVMNLNTNISYGISTPRGTVTPFAEFGTGTTRQQFGINWLPHKQIRLGLSGERTTIKNKAELKAEINF